MTEKIISYLISASCTDDDAGDTSCEFVRHLPFKWVSLVVQVVKDPPANAGDVGSIPGPGRSPDRRNGLSDH